MTITALINPLAPFRIALRARNLRLLPSAPLRDPPTPCVVAVLPQLATAEELPAANTARVSLTYICVVRGSR